MITKLNQVQEVSFFRFPHTITDTLKFIKEYQKIVLCDFYNLEIDNRPEELSVSITRVLGNISDTYSNFQDRIKEILNIAGPNILVIHGHGSVVGSVFKIGDENSKNLIPVQDLIESAVTSSEKPYNLVLIDACSYQENSEIPPFTFPQDFVDRLGLPICYIQGINSLANDTQSRVLQEPGNILIKSN